MILAEGLTGHLETSRAVRSGPAGGTREILGFLGPNGAGKSTTVKILTGMIRPTSGRAQVAGFDVMEHPLEVKRRIGYVPESGAMYDNLSAAEYLELVACLHHIAPTVAASRIDELLDLFDLTDVKNQRVTEYSKGMKQKVVLAAALIHRPDVLFLDEPLSGSTPKAALIVKNCSPASGTRQDHHVL